MKYLNKMKTNLNLSTNILKDYTDFERANTNWNILSYLNHNYDLNTALAFSKLFFPDFIEEKGCIILSFLYNYENMEEWYEEFNGKISEVEKMCNLYELKDFFHINGENNDLAFNELGKVLQISWALNLNRLFPEKEFKVDIFEEYNSLFITLYQIK